MGGSRWTEASLLKAEHALNDYGNERDWAKMRPDEMVEIVADVLFPVGEPDDRLTKLEAAAKDAMEALDEYLRGESGLPFAQPYPAARKAWERLNGALPDG